MNRSQIVHATSSGVIVKADRGLQGMLCFNPHTGLIYAIPEQDSDSTIAWLNHSSGAKPPHPIYHNTLGTGWATRRQDAVFPSHQLLPSRRAWPIVRSPERPITVNWLITGRCPLACRYCYAEDLMRDDSLEPTQDLVTKTASEILALAPVAVVITGGDPLFTPHLATAIEALAGRVGLIVDTSGYTLRKEHIELFASVRASIRISIDSQIPRIHEAQRPVSPLYPKLVEKGNTLKAAMDALCRSLDAGLAVTVQTVATRKTANDLVSLGDVLFRLGVQSWRIFKVAPSVKSMDGFMRLVGTHMDDGRPFKGKRARGPYEHAFSKVLAARASHWNDLMSIQVTLNESPNSVILVSPDGRFMTESNTGKGKIVLDAKRPRAPRLSAIHSNVDMAGHASRYLNLESPASIETEDIGAS